MFRELLLNVLFIAYVRHSEGAFSSSGYGDDINISEVASLLLEFAEEPRQREVKPCNFLKDR